MDIRTGSLVRGLQMRVGLSKFSSLSRPQQTCPPPKQKLSDIFSGNYRVEFGRFSGKYYVKFGKFVDFSGQYRIKFGPFVNFSYIIFGKSVLPPKLTELLRLCGVVFRTRVSKLGEMASNTTLECTSGNTRVSYS